MKKLLLAAIVLMPSSLWADDLDVIAFELNDDCSLAQYLAIKDDFNSQWARKYGYRAEIAAPLQSPDLATYYWVGRSESAEAFGKAWDAWRDQIANPDSVAGKLAARFAECGSEVDRRSYDVY